MTNEQEGATAPEVTPASPATQPQRTTLREFLSANRAAVIFALVALVALAGACVFAAVLLWLTVVRPVVIGEDPTPTPLSTAVPVPTTEGIVMAMDGTSTLTVTLDMPVTLAVKDRTFAVQPQVIAGDGIWAPDVQGETAVWVYGTIINYVMGLEDSEENRTFLEGLASGDQMVMTTAGEVTYNFSFNSRNLVAANNRDIYTQNVPGITLVLLGTEGQERLVVNGRYIVSETAPTTDNNVVELGEAAQLEDVQLTVTAVTYVPDRPEIPPGFAFYLVDYEIQNLGLTALDSNRLQLFLTDATGNQYVINPIASQVGNYPPVTGFLNANQTIQATAGYQIPATLTSPTLTWVVTRADTGSQLRVTIPFNGGLQAALGSSIALQTVDVTQDYTGIILQGQVTNVGNQPLVIVESDLSLKTADGATYLLLTTNPAFPWTVGPGQSMQFAVTYQRPLTADSATFTLLNQSFLLSGLR